MPEYLAPGVFVEETSFRSKSIEGVSTSTTGFAGPTLRGPFNETPELLTSFAEFERIYGGLDDLGYSGSTPPTNYLAHAVAGYFNEGGARLYVARVVAGNAATAASANLATTDGATLQFVARSPGRAGNGQVVIQETASLSSTEAAAQAPSGSLLRAIASAAGSTPRHLVKDGEVWKDENDATVALNGGDKLQLVTLNVALQTLDGQVASYEGLGIHPAHPRYVGTVLAEKPARRLDQLTQLYALKVEKVPALALYAALKPADDKHSLLIPVGSGLKGQTLAAFPAKSDEPAKIALTQATAAEAAAPNAPPLAKTAATNAKTAADALVKAFDPGSPAKPAGEIKQAVATAAATAKTAATAARAALADASWTDAAGKTELTQAAASLQTASEAALAVTALVAPGSKAGTDVLPSAKDYQDALKWLEPIDDISIVAAPGYSAHGDLAAPVALHLIAHAEKRRAYRIAVLDTPPDLLAGAALETKAKFDSKYAALYYPWVIAPNPLASSSRPDIAKEISLPPSGFVCGIYARSDIERGVFKAPANEVIRSALRLERLVSNGEHETLNPRGVNCLRYYSNRGFRVFGARTTSSDPEWKYVSDRRYFLYLEHSIDRGMQWAVFEPNGERLWKNIKESVSSFLRTEWENGALLGSDVRQAFFVECDRNTMSQNDLDNGRLICKIGVATVKPAEFVIFRIGQKTADARS
jgi:hypothetical protein